jgi:hypothetical protein
VTKRGGFGASRPDERTRELGGRLVREGRRLALITPSPTEFTEVGRTLWCPSATAGVLRSVGQSGLYVRRGRRIPNHVRMAGGSSSSSARCGKSHSFAYPVISPLRWLMQVVCSCYAFVSSLSRATRSCSSFALLMRYSNSRPLWRELFGHFVDPAWHITTDCRPEGHALTDVEFM